MRGRKNLIFQVEGGHRLKSTKWWRKFHPQYISPSPSSTAISGLKIHRISTKIKLAGPDFFLAHSVDPWSLAVMSGFTE